MCMNANVYSRELTFAKERKGENIYYAFASQQNVKIACKTWKMWAICQILFFDEPKRIHLGANEILIKTDEKNVQIYFLISTLFINKKIVKG